MSICCPESAEYVHDAHDLFAGPGGWDVAARELGLHVLGFELDAAACATRRAALLPTVEGDVRAHGPLHSRARGLIASPPCQSFSMAGDGAGRAALEVVEAAIRLMARRVDLAEHGLDFTDPEVWADERTGLVLEPLRWALEAIDAGRPYEWLAFEQVPTVLPVWELMERVLEDEGYAVTTGRLSSEQFGVPQTRKRAFLVARIDRPVALPAPTHRAYRKGVAQHEGDQRLLPWVSMAQALGWTEARVVVSNYGTGGDPANRGERTSQEPAAVVTSKFARNKVYVSSTMPNATRRKAEEPAPTVAFGNDMASVRWEPDWTFERPATTVAADPRIGQPGHKCMTVDCCGKPTTKHFDEGTVRVTIEEAAALQSFPADFPWRGAPTVYRASNQAHAARRGLDEPAPTVKFSARSNKVEWMPEETAQDPRADGVRVEPDQAAVLQSFPAGHRWKGSKTKIYEQIGNAVPPGLAGAVLAEIAF